MRNILILLLLFATSVAFAQYDMPNGGRRRPAEFKRQYRSENYSCDPAKFVATPSVKKKKALKLKAKRAKIRAKLAAKRAKVQQKRENLKARASYE